MTQTSLNFDNQYRKQYPIIAGCDEVGRGCLAGPLVSAVVLLQPNVDLPEVGDSKKISKKQHERLVKEISQHVIEVRFGIATPEDIDEYNVLESDRRAMRDMLNDLDHKPDLVLIDGDEKQLLGTEYVEKTIVKGDAKSLSVGAASLMAKYFRDELMKEYDKQYPGYGFAKNDGYGTKQHRDALATLGITPIHRKTFAPIKNHLHDWPTNLGTDDSHATQ